jgi:hypothetical protein
MYRCCRCSSASRDDDIPPPSLDPTTTTGTGTSSIIFSPCSCSIVVSLDGRLTSVDCCALSAPNVYICRWLRVAAAAALLVLPADDADSATLLSLSVSSSVSSSSWSASLFELLVFAPHHVITASEDSTASGVL